MTATLVINFESESCFGDRIHPFSRWTKRMNYHERRMSFTLRDFWHVSRRSTSREADLHRKCGGCSSLRNPSRMLYSDANVIVGICNILMIEWMFDLAFYMLGCTYISYESIRVKRKALKRFTHLFHSSLSSFMSDVYTHPSVGQPRLNYQSYLCLNIFFNLNLLSILDVKNGVKGRESTLSNHF